ncbi:DUF6325 family protein [Streptomyces virginiae]|uniref:DUF6325 family protein n=1 Tax=Streptomyces virginiae TaxID=1961 RepID=A0ABZ1TAM7_STRVG|nr:MULTISPECIES: DUF6325 family protein [Streptomyces]MCX4715976.1 DUF6325 family protein [Streptomyces virginiae]MCX4958118.1 DUF6325 family protein [Streptomyces virginiae]MCX5176947.1 DUF6325 family protein [Streptomyces virginiae]MCX5273720.1 DUF6325 family protein [Streptomyces virginiae]MYV75788.1 hypothetical protein [Streptomyces sp. SID1046]
MGPVEFIVLAFPEEQLRAPAVEAVMGLRKTGVVRLIDGIVATRTASGDVLAAEFDEFVELNGLLTGRDVARLIGPEDIQEAAGLLERGSCALLLVVEHLWAEDAAIAVRAAGGRIVGSVRIPPDRVPADPRAGVA